MATTMIEAGNHAKVIRRPLEVLYQDELGGDATCELPVGTVVEVASTIPHFGANRVRWQAGEFEFTGWTVTPRA